MNPARIMTQTGTITHRAAGVDVDEYNNPVAIETAISVAYELQQAARSEQVTDADWQVGDWLLFLAPTGIADGSTVETEADGSDMFTDAHDQNYEFVGPPWPVRNPRTGLLTHIEARVRRVN